MKHPLLRLRINFFNKYLLYIDNFFYLLLAIPIKKFFLNSNLKYLLICFFSIIANVINLLLFIFFQLTKSADVPSHNKASPYVRLHATNMIFLNVKNKEKIFSAFKHNIHFVNSSKVLIELDQYLLLHLMAKLIQLKKSVFHFDNFSKKIFLKNNVCLN